MIRNLVSLAFVLIVSTSLATGADEVPLDKLTTAQIRAHLQKAFDAPGTKQTIDRFLNVPGVTFTVTTDEIEYSYVAGKPRLIWRYRSPAALDLDQQMKVKEALRKVLIEALVQFKVEGKGLLTGADAKDLVGELELVRSMPVQNTPPTISTIENVTIAVGETIRVQFSVADKETPLTELKIAGKSSNPDLASPSQFEFTGKGPMRTLVITPTPGKTGSATIAVTVTDAGSLSSSTAFQLNIRGAKESPKPTYVTRAVVCYYAAPSYWGTPSCGCGTWVVPVVSYYQVPVEAAPSSSTARSTRDDQDKYAPTAPVRTDPSERLFSVVRRKLLLKNSAPADAVGLYLRAVKAYRYGEYYESLDLAWVAVQLDDQDARFWYAKALSERKLGDVASARVSARRGVALDVLARGDSVSALDRAGAAEQAFLRQASMSFTRETAQQIATKTVPEVVPARVSSRQKSQGPTSQVARQP